MPHHARPGREPKTQKNGRTEQRQQKRKRAQEDLQQLEQRVNDLDPKSDEIKNFSHLPLSVPTATGLEASHFQTLTDVQAHAIPLALKGKDLMGAAKTGSGKTLAFLVPVLEKLYRAQWTEYDGLGALIIAPTRELAVQIFEVLRKIGRNHVFSAGLVIGGKNLKEEAERLERMNILICTPGRMLQHLDQTAGFDANNLQLLVLDEADRIMDMGFQHDVDALVEHLPKSRQTLMFSATQSKKVSDLARLSLKDPEYVSVHEAAVSATPTNLQQHYIITPLTEKLDTLYGFIKANLKSKIIVFLSSGKQVRFVYESFRHLQPGIPLLHLHGRQKQIARMEITNRFTAAKQSCLFATDVVARGIDFPAVDWVIQADCPEDVDTYIHRVGRTARYQSNGRAVLFLDPSEEPGMLKNLEQKKIPIQKVNVKEKKKKSIKDQLQSMCFQNPDLKYLGQKAFISYTRSIHLQRDKGVFKFNKLDLDGFAASLGLPGTPQVKFRKGEDIKKIKNAPRAGMSSDSEMEEGGEKSKKKNEVRTKYDKMFERTNQDVLSSHYNKLVLDGDEKSDDDDGDFLSVKRVLKDDELDDEANNAFKSTAKVIDGLGGEEPFVVDSKRREKALKSKKKMLKFKGNSTKVVFDDDGNAHAIYELKDEEDFVEEGPAEEQRRKFVEDETSRVREADVDDKALAKQKRREKREKRKAAERAERMGIVSDDDDGDAPMLLNADGGEDPLALMRSLPMGGDRSDSEEDREPPKKRAKKWFEDDSEDEKKSRGKGRVIKVQDEPETLEDLEALATGLLD
ncbi:ATP-dependent RNA helicase DBP4 [Fusarium subglutinans]|uniref:ATP-dependent RNA helicase n=1 Tax=Gibberella subglutinans TaxID=42677 RepID=A0A8H5Q6F1_GIBSU|nr:ATP-dependent RNA helicase DBP4 [Fusarium subglutinans]KAF5610450.1 ATP-dependent RNA helicase DBP4 [Fusarium subglutinans]